MDNISKILDAIREDGKSEADKILASGEKNADEVMRLYREEADVSQAAIIKKAQKEADEILRRGVSQAGIESRNIKLTARRKALEKAFSLAGDELTRLSGAEKQDMYVKLIGKYSATKSVKIVLNEKDSKDFGDKLLNDIKARYGIKAALSDAAGDFPGGLIIEEGEVETNCTFEVLVNDIKKETESEIAAMLFA